MPPEAEILLVEDNPADAELILLALAESELTGRVHVVHDGAAALDYLEQRASAPPRLLLLDLKLPRVGGLDVLRRLKAAPHTRGIPVVMLTSSNVERDVVEAYRIGANSYVQKPVEFQLFRKALLAVGRYWLEVNEPAPARTFAVDPA